MAGTYEHINLSEECGFGLAGYCCSFCQMGPCRINPFSREKAGTACGFSRRQVAVAQLLCYLLSEAGDQGPAFPEKEGPESVSGIEGHVLRILGWIGRGTRAGVEEGIGLLVGLSSALLSLRAGNAGPEGRLREGSCRGDNVCLLDMDDSPAGEERPGLSGSSGMEVCRASLGHLLSICGKKGPETGDSAVVIVPAGRKARVLSVVIGLAACGFTVRARLPYILLADRRLMDLLGSILTGRIEELEEGGPGRNDFYKRD